MASFETELASIQSYFGYPRTLKSDDPEKVAESVLMGDGRRNEAVAAVVYWSDLTRTEAEAVVDRVRVKGRRKA